MQGLVNRSGKGSRTLFLTTSQGCHCCCPLRHTLRFSSFSRSVLSDSLRPHESQHARAPCPSSTPGVYFLPESIESVMPSSHLTLCHPLVLLPPIPPSIRVFSNESALPMRWTKYWSFSFSISPSEVGFWTNRLGSTSSFGVHHPALRFTFSFPIWVILDIPPVLPVTQFSCFKNGVFASIYCTELLWELHDVKGAVGKEWISQDGGGWALSPDILLLTPDVR